MNSLLLLKFLAILTLPTVGVIFIYLMLNGVWRSVATLLLNPRQSSQEIFLGRLNHKKKL